MYVTDPNRNPLLHIAANLGCKTINGVKSLAHKANVKQVVYDNDYYDVSFKRMDFSQQNGGMTF